MMCKPRKKMVRKKNPNVSTLMHDKARHKREHGMENDGIDWVIDDEVLMIADFVNNVPVMGPSSLMSKYQRSYKGIMTKTWKVGARYRGAGFMYNPIRGRKRDKMKWHPRESYLIRLALRELGRSNNAHDSSYLGVLLGRSPTQVMKHIEDLGKRYLGFRATTELAKLKVGSEERAIYLMDRALEALEKDPELQRMEIEFQKELKLSIKITTEGKKP